MVSVVETYPCDIAGTVRYQGALDEQTGTGTLTVTFSACEDYTGWIDGQLALRIDAYYIRCENITDGTLTFALLRVRSAGFDMSLSGAIRLQEAIRLPMETLTSNYVIRDNLTGRLGKIEDLVEVGSWMTGHYTLAVSGGRI